jgi:hypothetical protein
MAGDHCAEATGTAAVDLTMIRVKKDYADRLSHVCTGGRV